MNALTNGCSGRRKTWRRMLQKKKLEEAGRELSIEEVKVMQHEDGVKTAEVQHVKAMKTAVEEMVQHEDVVRTAEVQHVKVMKTAVKEMMQHEDVVKTAEIQHVKLMKTTDDDDEDQTCDAVVPR